LTIKWFAFIEFPFSRIQSKSLKQLTRHYFVSVHVRELVNFQQLGQIPYCTVVIALKVSFREYFKCFVVAFIPVQWVTKCVKFNLVNSK
jgi:hypothetical protein